MSNNITNDIALFNHLVLEFLSDEKENPVAEYISPEELADHLDISLYEKGINEETFRATLTSVLKKTPKSSSKLFFNQLFGGRHSKAVLGDLLAVIMNNSMATYKIAGPLVAIEKEVLTKVCDLIGYGKKSGGTFPTGGSMSNFMSMVIARDKTNIDFKRTGVTKNLVAYTSEAAHYSTSKNASLSGIGKNNLRLIECDKNGRIDLEDFKMKLKADLAKGFIPFYLNATAGTTVMCSFDNVNQLAPICKKHKIWLHLDGAFGGSVIFSKKYNYLVKGIEQTDSFCFNAHKTLGAPLSTSVFVVKEKLDLHNSFNNNAPYLYQTHNDDFNLGQTSFECGRRNNAFKLWAMWKSIGRSGLGKIIDHEFKLAELATNYIKKNHNYKIYSFEKSLSVCFNYKNYDPEDLCKKLYEKSVLMVGFGCFKKYKFIRLVIVNSQNKEDDILSFFKLLEDFVEKNSSNIKKI